jgi:alkanesulfonate monooxygenase SsuD/methylene tetrahydromethanopterin reductase-like flavin-dependent oxidoreductase (luciferase family)
MDLRTPGVFCFLDGLSGDQAGQFARSVEQLGYSALWFAEASGRESFSFASYLLSQTERLVVATGIAVIYAYEPIAVANASRTLGELFADRLCWGWGSATKWATSAAAFPTQNRSASPASIYKRCGPHRMSAPLPSPSRRSFWQA